MIYEVINNASFWTFLVLFILFLIILIFRFDKIYKALKGINGNGVQKKTENNSYDNENLITILKKIDKILASHLQYVSTSEMSNVQLGKDINEIQELLKTVNERIIRIDELLRK